MKFVTVRDFRTKVSEIRKELESDELVLTANGRPIAIVSRVNENEVEEELQAIRQARARMALQRVRQAARDKGLDRMSMVEVDGVVARSRKARKR